MTRNPSKPAGNTALTAAVCTVFVVIVMLTPWVSNYQFAGNIADNMHYFHDYSTRIARGDIPYRDFSIEYPPVSAAALALLAPFSKSFDTYAPAFLLLNLALWLACLFMLAGAADGGSETSPEIMCAVFTLLTLGAGPILFVSLDMAPAALALASFRLLTTGRRGAAFAVLAAAAAAKGYPVLLLPLWMMYRGCGKTGEIRRRPIREFATFAAAFAVFGCLPAVFSLRNFLGSYIYHAERGLEVASVYSAALIPLRRVGVEMYTIFDHNSWNLVVPGISATLARVSPLAQIALWVAALAVGRRVLRSGAGPAALAQLAVAAILGFLIPFKVASPQFIVWLIPLAAMAWAGPIRWTPVLLLFVAGNIQQWIYPWNWFRLVSMSFPVSLVLLSEKLLFILLLIWSLAAFRRAAGEETPAS